MDNDALVLPHRVERVPSRDDRLRRVARTRGDPSRAPSRWRARRRGLPARHTFLVMCRPTTLQRRVVALCDPQASEAGMHKGTGRTALSHLAAINTVLLDPEVRSHPAPRVPRALMRGGAAPRKENFRFLLTFFTQISMPQSTKYRAGYMYIR